MLKYRSSGCSQRPCRQGHDETLVSTHLRIYISLLLVVGRGLHWSTFRLNTRALYGKGVHLGVVQGVIMGYQGVLGGVYGVFLCQKRLRLSWKVDECEPLVVGAVANAAIIGGVMVIVDEVRRCSLTPR